MTAPITGQSFRDAWHSYVSAIRSLLERKNLQPNRRYLQAIESWQERVLAAADDSQLAAELERRFSALRERNDGGLTADLLLEELQQMPLIASGILNRGAAAARRAAPGQRNRDGLNAGKTILDSLLDLFEDLPFAVKGPLKVLGELLDIMKGA